MKGWPGTKKEVPMNLRNYSNYVQELSVQEGIILRGNRVIIPKSLRKEMLEKIHRGH